MAPPNFYRTILHSGWVKAVTVTDDTVEFKISPAALYEMDPGTEADENPAYTHESVCREDVTWTFDLSSVEEALAETSLRRIEEIKELYFWARHRGGLQEFAEGTGSIEHLIGIYIDDYEPRFLN